nr:MAG TPA: hypothetical protein [Caudoviricetes sp.]
MERSYDRVIYLYKKLELIFDMFTYYTSYTLK